MEVRFLDYKQKKKVGEDFFIVKDFLCQIQVLDVFVSVYVFLGFLDVEYLEVLVQVLVEEKVIILNFE